jgi:hypothetical protein
MLLGLTPWLGAQQTAVPARLYGTWVITRVLPAADITALSMDEAKALIGRRLTFAPRELDNGQARFVAKQYQTRVITSEQFLIENKVNLARLGVADDRITEVLIEGRDEWINDRLGAGMIYVTPNHHVIVAYRGFYFALSKAPPTRRN